MKALRIVDGKVWSGHYVFVRDFGTLSDLDLLAELGLTGYVPDREPRFPCRYAHIMRAGDWSAFADDWYYTAWHLPGIGDAVALLGSRYEVLRTAIGDSDESLEFHHFVGGALWRGFEFRDHAGTTEILLDTGAPLKCEADFELGSNAWPLMCAVVDEVGIDSVAMAESVSTYSKPR